MLRSPTSPRSLEAVTTASRTQPIRSRRLPRCEGCALPPPVCLCAELPRLVTRTRVVLLVHRVELHKTTNTARLAWRSLTNTCLLVRGAGAHEPVDTDAPGPRLVLFPAPTARVLTEEDARSVHPVTLVVPDGSWSQARRMTRRDPACTGGEVVRLPEPGESRYGLRRSPRVGGLCTLEAVARALAILEGADLEPPLVRVLDRFVERVTEVRRLGTRFRDPPAGASTPPSTA